MSVVAAGSTRGLHHVIVGTAGHIDHGKSALVKALTGIDPDRLPEEQARGMTIDLGFAFLDLPGVRVGVVDVPGHERFVRTMVAGATGIDLALLVVAVDDGVMPQTSEHIEILDFLGVTRGLVVLSKADVATHERINEVGVALRAAARGTAVAEWEQVAVSALRGDGLDALRARLAALAVETRAASVSGLFRLAIDRVFVVRGRGTVVTGSVVSGQVRPGDALEVLPQGQSCKVREVQTHGRATDAIGAGQRAALNVTGIDRESLSRGSELATPGCLAAARYIDVRLRISTRRERPLASHRRVRVLAGTREVIAAAVVLSGAAIGPGESGLVQFRLVEPIAVAHGQRLIVREENARATLGGAVVVAPESRRTRATPEVLEALARLESPDARARVAQVVRSRGFQPASALRVATLAGVSPDEAAAQLGALRESGQQLRIGPAEAHVDAVADLEARALAQLARHHLRAPLEPGMVADRLVGWVDRRSVAGVGRALVARMSAGGTVDLHGPFVAAKGFRPALSSQDAALLERLVAELSAAGLDPPEWAKLKVLVGLSRERATMLAELVRGDGRLVEVAPQLVAAAAAIERLKEAVSALGAGGQRFKLGAVRDRLNLSRRSVLPLLEYLDRTGFTRRVGDERVVVEKKR